MASRKEEKDRLRAERLEAEKREAQEARRRLMVGYIVAGALALAVLVGLVVVIAGGGGGGGSSDSGACGAAHIVTGIGGSETFGVAPDCREGKAPPAVAQADLQKAAHEAGCDLQLNLPDEGHGHVGGHVDYDTNPPTSGDHNPVPQADGAYTQEPQPEHFVHSLEHMRVEFQYSPDLPEQDQLAIKGVFDEDPGGILLFPNPEMPYEVAATAWTQLVGCKKYEGSKTLDVLRDFRDTYRGHGPPGTEPFPF
jgi:Protein of unknown function (DUF3105)